MHQVSYRQPCPREPSCLKDPVSNCVNRYVIIIYVLLSSLRLPREGAFPVGLQYKDNNRNPLQLIPCARRIGVDMIFTHYHSVSPHSGFVEQFPGP